jgi:Hg(II)-responsive transcriptional regulator
MRIGRLAAQAGVNVQTLRYYERRGLLEAPHRTLSGFREYADETVRRVRFVRRAQGIGFTLEEIRGLLNLWPDSSQSCRAVEKRARATLERIDGRIEDLQRMRKALSRYVSACRDRSALRQCPLLAGLGERENGLDG